MSKQDVIRIEKTVDVVYMEEKIDGESILTGILDNWEMHQDGFRRYTIGDFSLYDDFGNSFWKKFDEILMSEKYGLTDGESVVLLVWW